MIPHNHYNNTVTVAADTVVFTLQQSTNTCGVCVYMCSSTYVDSVVCTNSYCMYIHVHVHACIYMYVLALDGRHVHVHHVNER